MKSRILGLSLVLFASVSGAAPTRGIAPPANPSPTTAARSASAVASAAVAPASSDASSDASSSAPESHSLTLNLSAGSHGHPGGIVSVGHDARLGAGHDANSVVSVFGSSTAAGQSNAVVSLFGDTAASGDVDGDAVAVFGNTTVDARVSGDVVAVFGSVRLGPHADVGGDVVAVGGTVTRARGAVVHGQVQDVQIGALANFQWLRPWIQHCLLYGRPLALAPGVAWAWWVAGGFLVLYWLLAIGFRDGLMRCVTTLESRPGRTLVASLLALLAMPALVMLLLITVVGVFAIPFVAVSLLCVQLFGKAVALVWLGRLVTGRRSTGMLAHPAVTVLLGGVIVTGIYLVPAVGFAVHQALTLLGLGAVAYTLILIVRERQATAGGSPRGSAPTAPITPTTPTTPTAPTAAAGPANPGVGDASAAAEPATVAPAARAPIDGSPRAGFWIRIAALLIDAILVGIVASLVVHRGHVDPLLLAAYGAVMWKLRGSTVGGIILHQRVVRADGRELDWPTAIVRALACFLSLAVLGLGFIWIAIDPDKQAWHDKIAGTIVVRTAPAPSLV
jgi:uncharacterized RDD family membrane protein YckC